MIARATRRAVGGSIASGLVAGVLSIPLRHLINALFGQALESNNAVVDAVLTPLVYWVLPLALAITGAALAHRILVNRIIDHDLDVPGTCSECGYDLRGLGAAEGKCPECGHEFGRVATEAPPG